MGVIALTTDFGWGSAYVAQMKGVLLSATPDCRIVDISHSIKPQDVQETALLLRGTAFSLPLGTVHLVVVDPGVGTDRRAIAIKAKGMFFVGPDNGVLGDIAALEGAEVVHLNKPEFFREPLSTTFHGRDIFAPVAAELAAGLELTDVGTVVTDPHPGLLGTPSRNDTTFIGQVLGPDSFGNLMTNLPGNSIDQTKPISLNDMDIPWVQTYAEAQKGELVVLLGSDGFAEIAVRDGSALEKLGPSVVGAGIECPMVESAHVD